VLQLLAEELICARCTLPPVTLETGNEALARGNTEEDGNDAQDDGEDPEPTGAQRVAQDAEHNAHCLEGDARAVAQEGGKDANYGKDDPDEAGDLTGEKPHSNLAFESRILARFSDIFMFPLNAAPSCVSFGSRCQTTESQHETSRVWDPSIIPIL
jgi:hypothetical protein